MGHVSVTKVEVEEEDEKPVAVASVEAVKN